MKGYYIREKSGFTDSRNLRIINALASAVSVSGGIIIYLLYRKNTFLFHLTGLSAVSGEADTPVKSFITYYFADFLWAFSFNCAVVSVLSVLNKKSFVSVGALVASFGFAIEFMQYKGIIGGTFDITDIIMYCSAALICTGLNILIIEKR